MMSEELPEGVKPKTLIEKIRDERIPKGHVIEISLDRRAYEESDRGRNRIVKEEPYSKKQEWRAYGAYSEIDVAENAVVLSNAVLADENSTFRKKIYITEQAIDGYRVMPRHKR